MVLPVIFGNLTSPVALSDLDENFAALGALSVISGTLTGTSSLSLAPAENSPSVSAYANNMLFSGISPASNTASVRLAVGTLSSLLIYKDTPSGPLLLTGGEIATGNYLVFAYDSSLNAGAGGFHLISNGPLPTLPVSSVGEIATVTSNAGVTLTAPQLTTSGTGQGIVLRRGSPSGGITDTTDTAANMVGLITGPQINTTFKFRMVNTSGQTVTLAGGTGVTIVGSSTTATGASHDFIGIITSVSSPAVSIFG